MKEQTIPVGQLLILYFTFMWIVASENNRGVAALVGMSDIWISIFVNKRTLISRVLAGHDISEDEDVQFC